MFSLSSKAKSIIIISALVLITLFAILLAVIVSDDIIVTIILIALILLVWPVGYLVRHYLRERAARTPAPDNAKRKEEPVRPVRSYKNLESGAAETIDFLRRNRSVAPDGGDAIYGLPWFL